jgi:hypothetical protein
MESWLALRLTQASFDQRRQSFFRDQKPIV